MIDYTPLYDRLAGTPFESWDQTLPGQIAAAFDPKRHGDITYWFEALDRLPQMIPSSIDFNTGAVRVGEAGDLSSAERETLITLLRAFHPWRKGPFDLFGIDIDAEWRSDWKWDRVASAISPLEGRRVLDVGSGNGYYGWRMRGAGAELVVGVDPYMLYCMQYGVVRHFLGDHGVYVLPMSLEEMPASLSGFDTVFSMGVLYHRKSPLEHLQHLHHLLNAGGELVLETLVVEGPDGYELVPEGRYAMMRNVWRIPSPATLLSWLAGSGFEDIRLVDQTITSTEEQRSTPWMRFHSLADYLDPENPDLTVEGYPRPRRAVVVARKMSHWS